MTRRARTVLMTITAALVAAGLAGCEEKAGPIGPSAPILLAAKGGNPGSGGGGGGGGTTPLAEVTVAGAISTEGVGYTVDLFFKDTKRTLELGTRVVSRLDFLATHDAGLAPCVTDEPATEAHKQALLELLVDPAQDRVLWMTVDKNSLGAPASNQGVSQPEWNEEPGTLYSLGVNTSAFLPQAGSPTVTQVVIDASSTAYTFQGGVVNIKDRSQLPHIHLICPNLDVVTVTVRRL